MAGVLDGVNQRTRLAGHNRLELLLFRLGDKQRFGINVFKVQEVIQCPPLTKVPHAHPVVRGVATLRGKTITIMDLAQAIGRRPITDTSQAYIIITEYNRAVQGFLVSGVDRIVNMNWEEILPPPKGSGHNYMTAVTRVDNDLVEIIDVEKVLAEVIHVDETVTSSIIEENRNTLGEHKHRILVADDSSVARNQIKRTLDQLGVETILVKDGREALDTLRTMAESSAPVTEQISMVISDVEMPEMDGYTLTTQIRSDNRLKNLYVILHTSLSGIFNNSLIEKVGADKFIAKFKPDELANAVIERLKTVQ
ncbi:chemotaxis protein CheV [Sulfurivermis fontis]|jgi:two-component system chemotaxis response regulator CheV|uniref:chemotaxis protein CheV n=1 Tax=Sulfurivermis fontis TaxID=1972068 RepID=UPI000FD84F61|nr:chemotaxis protein CheV [Sulfurivermis fontis]